MYAINLKSLLPLFFVALVAAFSASCATVSKGRTQAVSVNSSPAGAEVLIDGQLVGVTPLRVEVSRKNGAQVQVKKKGFSPQIGYFRTVPNEHADDFFRFRSDENSGANNNVVPKALHFNLVPDFLPTKRGEKPVGNREEMLARAAALLQSGQISSSDHLEMVQVINFYYAP